MNSPAHYDQIEPIPDNIIRAWRPYRDLCARLAIRRNRSGAPLIRHSWDSESRHYRDKYRRFDEAEDRAAERRAPGSQPLGSN